MGSEEESLLFFDVLFFLSSRVFLVNVNSQNCI